MADRPRVLFVTGKLAEGALREVVVPLGEKFGFTAEVAVLKITVAALMHAEWVGRHLRMPSGIERVVLPGWCQGSLEALEEKFGVPFERGPKDLLDLPQYFGAASREPLDLSQYNIEILAEINHAPSLPIDELLRQATHYRDSGADIIDIGCVPGATWAGIGDAVRLLKAEGFRLSIDSFDQQEVTNGVTAGAELVLSCNSGNVDWARDLPVEWVVIPDLPSEPATMDETARALMAAGRAVRCDAILEPVGFGFAASLRRYYALRERWPEIPIMMGVGNVTELSEVDSAGVNFLLAALCEELQIGSVLATEVINWGRSAIREFDIARRLVRHALSRRVLPKNVGGQLVLLRDPRLKVRGEARLREFAGQITDPNFRIFAERGEVHLMNRDGYWHGSDPYEVFDRMIAAVGTLDAPHAFYLGMELQKARTALTLGKNYVQDEALRWGFLTEAEISAVQRRKQERQQPSEGSAPCPPALH